MMSDRRNAAQLQAIRAVTWLAAQDELFDAFLANTGATARDVKENLDDSGFLCGVLDFILMQDQWVLDCSEALSQPPQTLVEARAILGGGDMRHWT